MLQEIARYPKTVYSSREASVSEPLYIAASLLPKGRGPALPGFTPDHRFLVIPNELSDNVSIFSLEELRVVHTIPLKAGSRPWQVKTIPPEGRYAYVSNSRFSGDAAKSSREASTVSLLDLETGKVEGDIRVGAGPNGVTVDRQGRRGYVVNMRSDCVSVLDVRSHTVVDEIRTGRAPAFAKLTLDGTTLAITNLQSASLTIVETETLRIKGELEIGMADLAEPYAQWGPGDTTGIAIDSTGIAFVTNYRTSTIVAVDLATMTMVRCPSIIKHPFFVEIDRDRRTVVFSSGVEGKVAVMDADSREWLGSYRNDGTEPICDRLSDLNLWMTDPRNNRITALLPRGLSGISLDWNRNMVTKFM